MSDGGASADNNQAGDKNNEDSEATQIRRDIAVLLDYLEQLADNRLSAQFKDTRPGAENAPAAEAATGASTRPPCSNYADFLNRLDAINRNGAMRDEPVGCQDGDPKLSDISFLRWSRNFLASIAAPATVQSIALTKEFLEMRGHYVPLLTKIRRAITREKALGSAAEPARLQRLRLPRSFGRLERGLILVTFLTVIISAYAMVGKYISDQRADALNSFSSIVHDVDADTVLLPAVADGQVSTARGDALQLCTAYARSPATGAVKVSDSAADSDRPAIQAALKLVQDCRQLQWATRRLIGETVRMKSWETIFIGNPNGSVLERIGSVFGFLIGWSYGDVSRSDGNSSFCRSIAGSAGAPSSAECSSAVFDLVKEAGSTSSSILGWITLFLVPSLYALIGAGGATMLELRRKVDTCTLLLSDRNRIAYNMILGSAFGAIIGMFSRSLGSQTSIGPAALALLAGFNTAGVFAFLDQLSKQLFRGSETPPAAK
jgi:hypothetical protein